MKWLCAVQLNQRGTLNAMRSIYISKLENYISYWVSNVLLKYVSVQNAVFTYAEKPESMQERGQGSYQLSRKCEFFFVQSSK